MLDIFMVAGEISGDLLGSSILESLMKKRKELEIVGIGGPHMRAQALFPTIPMEELQVMGFIDVIKHLPRLIKIFRSTVKTILD
ncbi:MAG: lipid-A-disaccharide synthase, partial [Rhabdochlamydiaceae bacterium]